MSIKTSSLLILLGIILLVVGVYFISIPKPMSQLIETQALGLLISERPELAAYQNTSLPPSSIESKQASEGWYFGFIRKGSGIPGILDAKCFLVKNNKNITMVGEYAKQGNTVVDDVVLETCQPIQTTPQTPPEPVSKIWPYGSVNLGLGEIATFKTISIRPLSIEEDSRCPVDVQCIQAGTVRVKIQLVSSLGTSTSIVKLNQEFTTKGRSITLTNVTPSKNSKVGISNADYRFTFNVVPQAPVVKVPQNKCYIGGCSAQLCTNQPDVVSTCEYTEKYACYKTATCENQPSGECGWTPTPQLTACLAR